jgi:hypothetical protein
MTINTATGVVSWPTPTIVGSPHTILIRATNSAGMDDESWTLTVERIAPVIVAIDNESHPCGSPYTGPTPTVTNPACMSPVTWSLDTGPAGMTINAVTGVLSWPTPVSGSTSTIIIRATNSAGFDVEGWRLAIDPLAPIVRPISDATIPEAAPHTGPTPMLTDPTCMEPITAWTLVSGPAGMTIDDASGVVSWPSPTSSGSPHTVTIRATNASGFDEESWLLTVTPAACPGPLADANCDGAVNFFDIDPFVLALFDLPAYQAGFCNGDICAADVNCDDLINFFDIDPFVACLFGGCAACP